MNNILEVRNIQKSFGKFNALKNINFEIKEGRIVGLLGKNGAGKTTLIKTILGLYKNFDGEILYQGVPLNTDDEQVMRSIGVLVDTKFHEDLTAFDNLMLLLMASGMKGNKKRKNKIIEILNLVGLSDNARDKVKAFSMGMKQRLALAQALMVDAKLLILDEPFVGLDPLGIELIKERLQYLCREKGVSIIFSSHQLAEVAELSEDIIVINEGMVSFMGTYDSLINENKRYHIKMKGKIKFLAENTNIQQIKGGIIYQGVPFNTNDGLEYGNGEVIIKKSDHVLSAVLLEILENGVEILDIEIEENALLQLFKDSQKGEEH